jgi:hypothetical protein
MGNSYNELRTLAFRVSPDAKACASYQTHPFWVMSLPESLREAARRTIASAQGRNTDETRLPMSVLNKAVRLFVPDLLAIAGNADQAGIRPWLYAFTSEDAATEPASSWALRQILSAWIRAALHKKVSQESREALVKRIDERELSWHHAQIDLTSWQVAPNKTARPYVKDTPLNSFFLLPDVAAARLCATAFRWGAYDLRFRRASRGPGHAGVELISWPPLDLEDDEGEKGPCSVLLTLTLQTVPFQSYPELHCDIGIRRWASQSTRIPGRVYTSIYLLDSVPWIEGTRQSHSFQVAPAAWVHVPEAERGPDASKFRFSWSGDLVALLNQLHPMNQLPDPQEIKDHPHRYLYDLHGRASSQSAAAIVFRSSMTPPHIVGTGLSPRERHGFTEQLAAALQPELVLTPAYVRLVGTQKRTNPFFPGPDSSKKKPRQADEAQQRLLQLQAERRLALSRTAERITVELWWQSAEVLQALRQALHTLFGYPIEAQDGFAWSTPEVTIVVRSQPLGGWGSALHIAPGPRETLSERLRAALRERAEQITSADLPPTRGRTLALVELAGAEAFDHDNDPKPALKIGYGKSTRLVQCITPLPAEIDDLLAGLQQHLREKLTESAQSAVRDLMRQCGVLGRPPRVELNPVRKGQQPFSVQIPEPLHYLAVWMIKHYRKSSRTRIATRLPVIVHMASNSYGVDVIAPGFRDWMTYPDASLALLEEQGRSVQKPEEFQRFLRETLARCLPAFKDTLLFCDARNLRSQWWPWLQNEQITEQLPPPLQRYPLLRIVRTRTGTQEIPEWYAQGRVSPYGFSQGVFAIGDSGHVFACVQAKPATATQSKEVSKVEGRTVVRKTGETREEGPQPGAFAWNPAIVEMTVSCMKAEDAPMSAVVANELRSHFAAQVGAATVFPLPLHLASQLDEYVLPLAKDRQAYTESNEAWWDEEEGEA